MDAIKLRNAILSAKEPKRELVIAYVQLLCKQAERLAPSEREAKGDYRQPGLKFPQTKGEDIASDISSLLAQQDWISWETDPELEEVGSIASDLEINTTDSAQWRNLFDKVKAL